MKIEIYEELRYMCTERNYRTEEYIDWVSEKGYDFRVLKDRRIYFCEHSNNYKKPCNHNTCPKTYEDLEEEAKKEEAKVSQALYRLERAKKLLGEVK